MPEDIERCASALHDTINSMSFNYQSWEKLTNFATRDEYLETMNHYTLFFQGAIHAYFTACIIACYRVFKNRPDTHNMHRLSKLVDSHPLSHDERQSLDRLFESLAETFRGIAIILSNVFAHYSHKIDLSEAFTEANISPRAIGDYVGNAQRGLNLLSRRSLGRSYAFNLSPAEDLARMLEDLKALRSAVRGDA